jgi:Lamin Tail Domain/CHU_C Type IX secretion signal domain/Bacterial Ig-like domain
MRKLFIFFFLLHTTVFAQVTDNFEDGNIIGWTESTSSRWEASAISPINGTYTLHHTFDNLSADKDRISYALPNLNLSLGTTIWQFQIKYDYNPSDGNNWSVFLIADHDASEMISGGNVNGYAIGVNLTGSDDTLKIWKAVNGSFSTIIKANIDWEDNVGNGITAGLEVTRDLLGNWTIKIDNDGGFDNFVTVGSGQDDQFVFDNYFGIYYEYTASADQLLWFDDFSITYTQVDSDADVIDPTIQVSAANISSLNDSLFEALEVFKFQISDGATSDLFNTNLKKIRIKNTNPANNADWSDHIQGIFLKTDTDTIYTDSVIISDLFIDFYIPKDSLVVESSISEEISCLLFFNKSNIQDGNKLQFYIDADNHGWEVHDGTQLLNAFSGDIISNIFTIDVTANSLFLKDYNSSIIINSNFSLSINAVDANENVDTDATNSITIALIEGAGNLSSTSLQKNLVNGEVLWNDIKYNALGNFSIGASTAGLTEAESSLILSEGNKDSYLELPGDQIPGGSISSLSTEIPVFKFKIVDAGSGDLLPTAIKQLNIKNSNLANSCNWQNTIQNVALNSTSQIAIDSFEVEQDNIILYFASNAFEVVDASEEEFVFSIIINNDSITDNTNFQCEIAASNDTIITYDGSSFLSTFPGDITSNIFTFEVLTTKLKINESPTLVYRDSLFSTKIYATDIYGNIDIDFAEDITISENFGLGTLSTASFTKTFASGLSFWNDLKYNTNVEFGLNFNNTTIGNIETDTINCIDLILFDDFETGTFSDWKNTSHWNITNEDSINGNFSLKHNNTSVSDTSYIFHKVSQIDIETGTFIWQFNLKNGNFDPSSSNYFAFYLLSNDSIPSDTVSAYALGVNLEGSSDLLSLWYIETGIVKETIIESNFNWDKNDFLGVEILRESNGDWTLKYDTTGNFDDFVIEEKASHSLLSDYQYSGLKFRYTTSYGGLLWFDDLSSGLMNTEPRIKNVSFIAADSMLIEFTEEIEITSAENISNYLIEPDSTDNISILNAELLSNNKTIKLSIDSLVTDNYILQVSSIADLSGLVLVQESYDFKYTISSSYGDIVITEIMADPSPSVGLPEYEYFEIYNSTLFDIPIENWTYVIGNDTNYFSEYSFKPDSYLIITSGSGADTLDYYGSTYVGIGSTELTNAGKNIRIMDSDENLVYDLNYTDSWYNDEEKEDGGYSLEIINPNNYCSTQSNWKASEAMIGGTPGSVNSVDGNYIDTIAPIITNYSVFADSVHLVFSEQIDTISVKVLTNFIIDNGIGRPKEIFIYDDFKTIDLFFENSLQNETDYILSVQNIEDECGNFKNLIDIDFTFYIPKKFDIVVTEIMADPSPAVGLPAYEYLELYNVTSFDIALDGWQIYIGEKSRTISDVVLQANSYLIVSSTSGADTLNIFGETYVGIGSTDLTNSGNTILVINNIGDTIYSVTYSSAWYKNEEKEDGGWSLEIINPKNTCSTISNWSASNASIGGTPGTLNSINSNFIDNYAPELLEFNLITNNSIQLKYNELLDSVSVYNRINYFVDGAIGNPDNIFLDEDMKTIEISFENSFIDETSYILLVQDIEDECGNYKDSLEIDFTFYLAKSYDIVINEIMADPEPQVGLPATDFIEIYSRSDFEISLSGWSIEIGNSKRIFENEKINPHEYLILTSNGASSLFSTFGDVVEIIGSSDLTTTGKSIVLRDHQSNLIDSLFYNKYYYHDTEKDDGGWTIEKIDNDNTCSSINNWTASINESGGTPGEINSVYSTYIDSEKPNIIRVKAISQFQLQIDISEFIDVESASNLLKYNVDNNIGNPSYFSHSGIYSSILNLTFTDVFENGKDYILYVSGLKDECGNIMNDTSLTFTYYYINTNDVVINEIMFDPSPVVGLPEYEYIEIYNRTEEILEISGWKLMIDDSRKSIPDFTLESNQYLILCSLDADSIYSEFTNSLGISGFPSLGNTDEEISLLDTAEREITSLHYFNHWYNNAEKADGGYSIERIDFNNLCSTKSNWIVSDDETGGTPGEINSVYQSNVDDEKPSVSEVYVKSLNEIQIQFSEELDEFYALEITNYYLNESSNPDSIIFDSIYKNQVDLVFTDTEISVESNNLKVINISDECGNVIDEYNILVSYYEPAYNEVVINEIMFDYEPVVELPEAEYIELYNPTNQQISFVNTKIVIGTSNTKIPNFNIEANEYLLLTDFENESLFLEYGKVIGIENMPSISNSGALIQISGEDGKIYSVVEFSDSWIDDPFKEDGGWSLELIDPNNPFGISENWSISIDKTGGTPAKQNSVSGENPDIVSPTFNRITVLNDSTIKLFFSESIDTINLQTSMFTVDHSVGNPLYVDPEEPVYNKIILTFDDAFEFGTMYELSVNESLSDISGNGLEGNLSQYFALPSETDFNSIVINEILFNPKDEGVDYVEIYNKSFQTFNLKNMFLTTKDIETREYKTIYKINEEGYLIFPESYLVLTTDPAIVKEQYYTENINGFVTMDKFPSLANEEGIVCLTDTIGNIIDEVYYTEDLHFQLLNSFDGVSLERLNFDRLSKDLSNWHSAAEQVGFGTPAYKNSQFTESTETSGEIALQTDVFSPDNDGFNDVLLIDYNFDQPGNTANCYIYNAKGAEVRHLLNNELLATEGTVSWDGLNNDQTKVSIGIYIIYFEIFDSQGNVKNIKKTCVVASKL